MTKYEPDQYVYMEGDDVNSIYFLKRGKISFVLMKYHDVRFINIGIGE